MAHRLWEPIEVAEDTGTDVARLAAYDKLREMIEWLRCPLVQPQVYDEPEWCHRLGFRCHDEGASFRRVGSARDHWQPRHRVQQ
jgi:hypothetical protein